MQLLALLLCLTLPELLFLQAEQAVTKRLEQKGWHEVQAWSNDTMSVQRATRRRVRRRDSSDVAVLRDRYNSTWQHAGGAVYAK
jgi:hypothetical protein